MTEREITKLRESLTPELASAIESVVAYNWDDEQADFEDRCLPDEDGEVDQEPSTHIFSKLDALNEWLRARTLP